MNPSDTWVLDPDARRLLGLIRKAGRPPFEALAPVDARAAYAASWDVMQSLGGEVASVEDRRIAGPGGELAVRIYRGLGTAPEAVLPGLLFLHGGGWVIGNLDSHDRLCRRLASVAGLCVIAVDYRLAPEHPFPAALDDAMAALQWMQARAQALRITPAALGVAGDSAGGNVAAAVALLARDAGLPLACQALIYPALDLTADSASYRRVVADAPLTAATMHYFIRHYTPDPAQRLDWRASPLRAPALAGLPPTLVFTVAHDPLCDEGLAYVQRLDAAGVRVHAVHCNDQTHGLLGQGRFVPAADSVGDSLFRWIGDALHRVAARAPAFSTPAADGRQQQPQETS